MEEYNHIWGQETINLRNKDLASLKLQRCMKSLHTKEGRALEIGCGAGTFIRSLKSYIPSLNCYGGDIDEDSIKLAETYDDNVLYAVFNGEKLPYKDGVFDVILLFDIIEHVENPYKLLDEIMRVSKQGSTVHIYVPCEKEPFTIHWLLWKIRLGHDLKKKHAGHIQRFSQKEFINKIKEKTFEIKKIEYSTYLLAQMVDILYYISHEFKLFKKSLQYAHATKNSNKKSEPIFIRVFKKIINFAFFISYTESLLFRQRFFAQGVHLTCTKR